MSSQIAFIMPGSRLAESVKDALCGLSLHYPVYKASSEDAVRLEEKLFGDGVRIILSTGATYQDLNRTPHALIMEMVYGIRECAAALTEAEAGQKKTAVIGSPALCDVMEEALLLTGMKIDMFRVAADSSFVDTTYEVIQKGYEAVISGYPSVQIAREEGLQAIGIGMSAETVRLSVRYAEYILEMMNRAETRYAALHAIVENVSEGIIGTDADNRVIFINPAALQALGISAAEAERQNLKDIFQKQRIINMLDMPDRSMLSGEERQIIARAVPLRVGSQLTGNVISVDSYQSVHDTEQSVRRSLHQKGLIARKSFADIIGTSHAMQQVIGDARRFAVHDSTVLILGETGTGKEVFAQSIHNAGPRRHQPFVAVNCAAIPETLLESELFGYVGGAFTGASREGKAGLFETAHGGTVFLDEISEIPVSMQARLLRVLQEREITRVGDHRVIPVDVRVIASSNRDLKQMVSEGKFRQDLYYRLSVLILRLPPLRERDTDVLSLAEHLIRKNNPRLHTNITGMSPALQKAMLAYPWPGNIRELTNIMEQMMVLSDGTLLDVPLPVEEAAVLPEAKAADKDFFRAPGASGDHQKPHTRRLSDAELALIQKTLSECGGNKKQAAAVLGIHPTTLWRKLKAVSG